MIRSIAAAALALILAACGVAKPEDMTAHFAKTGGKPFAVEALANGDSRIVAGDETYLRISGTDYIVMQDAKGPFVARAEDLFALLTEPAAAARPQPEYVASAGGSDTIAGVTGTVWKIHPKEIPSLASVDAVLSQDPALAVVGKGLGAHLRALILRNSRGAGGPGNLEQAMIALGEKGTVLRFGTVIRLERIDRAPIDPARFKLPSAPLGRDALRQRLAEPPAAG